MTAPAAALSGGAADLLARWLTQLSAAEGRSRKTVEAYARDVSAYLCFLAGHTGGPMGRAALGEIGIGDLRAFLAAERARGLSARSLARRLSAVRSFHAWLERAEGVACPAVEAVRAPRLPRRLPRPVAEADARAVLEHAGGGHPEPWIAARDRAVLTLLFAAGLRVGEALGLRGRDRPLGETVRVTGKGGKTREVPVLPVARAAVEAYAEACPHPIPADGALFRGARGGALDSRQVRRAMEAARAALGLPETATPHALRHAFATEMLAAGGDLRAVQELLGHASLASTQIYTGIDEARLRAVYEAAHPRAKA